MLDDGRKQLNVSATLLPRLRDCYMKFQDLLEALQSKSSSISPISFAPPICLSFCPHATTWEWLERFFTKFDIQNIF